MFPFWVDFPTTKLTNESTYVRANCFSAADSSIWFAGAFLNAATRRGFSKWPQLQYQATISDIDKRIKVMKWLLMKCLKYLRQVSRLCTLIFRKPMVAWSEGNQRKTLVCFRRRSAVQKKNIISKCSFGVLQKIIHDSKMTEFSSDDKITFLSLYNNFLSGNQYRKVEGS